MKIRTLVVRQMYTSNETFEKHVVSICTFKLKFHRNPEMLIFDFNVLQIHLRPGKVLFATVPNIRLAR